MPQNLFVNRETGVLVRVDKTDASYAYLSIMGALPSHWAMPKEQYDKTFAFLHRPAGLPDASVDTDFDLPAATPRQWFPEAAPVEAAPAKPAAKKRAKKKAGTKRSARKPVDKQPAAG